MHDLAKHVAGQPLTAAELEQRRKAAKARWAAVGAAIAGSAAAAGGIATNRALGRKLDQAADQVDAAMAPLDRARALNEARRTRNAAAFNAVDASLAPRGSKTFLSNAQRVLRWKHAYEQGRVQELYDRTKEPIAVLNPETGATHTEFGSFDVEGLQRRRDQANATLDTLKDIQENGRPSQRLESAAPKGPVVTGAHTRTIKAGQRAIWGPGAHEHLTYLFDRLGLEAPVPPKQKTNGVITARPTRNRGPKLSAYERSMIAAGMTPEATPEPKSRSAKQALDGIQESDFGGGERKHGKRAVANRLREGRERIDARLAAAPSSDGRSDELRRKLSRVRSLDDIETLVRGMPKAARDEWLAHHLLPEMKLETTYRQVPVKESAAKVIAAGRHTVDGYPNRAARSQLAENLRYFNANRSFERRDAERKRAVWRVVQARMQTRAAAAKPLARLQWLRHPAVRGAGAGLGAAAAGIGTALALRGVGAALDYFHVFDRDSSTKLGKAFEGARLESTLLAKAARKPPKPKTRASALDGAEAAVAERLAAAFGSIKDSAEARMLGQGGATLHADMLDKFGHALEPLETAAHAGASDPMPVVANPRNPATIAFSMLARSPFVQDYITQYRLSRVVELANEQVDAIKGQLVDAALAGASPQQMARRIKETIGLTSSQMQHVNNYRAELEQLHPNALKRELRDRRFDSPVARSVETGEVLTPEQIDRYVDAYHRRYLALRATTIARTEGVGAANNGQMAAASGYLAQHPGYTAIKTWHATADDRTRHDHRALDGQEVEGLDTPFRCSDGSEIRWPHDPAAPADQVINCRCTCSVRLVSVGDTQTGDDDEDAS